MNPITYQAKDDHLLNSERPFYNISTLKKEEMIINIGPQHPSTHGVLRLEILTDGEIVLDIIPHIGYLHRCFEKHAENLPYPQIIPFVDRLDYVASMNNEHAFVMGVEKMLGLEIIDKRIEYIRVLVAELNRISSHFVALGTYSLDLGSFTPFLWLMRDREHILRLLEWVSGARMLYNYIWCGGLYYDLPIGFEERCIEFINYMTIKMKEVEKLLFNNFIYKKRTANIGVLPLKLAINSGVTGPMLRASGLRFDIRKADKYSVYPEIEFEIPIGEGIVGTVGDCWDRSWVRYRECQESMKIIRQCLSKLIGEHKRTPEFDAHKNIPKKIRPIKQDFYIRAENPKGELGFYFRTDGKTDIPYRCKVRSCSFSNLSVLPSIAKGCILADVIAIIGSLDLIMGEVDR
ncbi:MAG: NADH-quinone oxidoreductase subunit D [Chitinophagaceae bacterium]|nr:NADH-quinone oxidoreductase subunit D [Chitinophagaceae bacterium]